MSKKILRIATRKSPLALWQAHHIKDMLIKYWLQKGFHLHIEVLPMQTSGDQFLKDSLLSMGGGKGLFVKELEEALLDRRADFAVHSMKDVPHAFPDGLGLGAICTRHNPLDAFVSVQYEHFESLPQQSTIGTISLRRQSQLLIIRPDLQMKALRGNIQTRLAKLQAGEYDAIVLAAAGLERMGLQDVIREVFNTDIMLPACGQGALGIEYRTHDEDTKHYIAPLNDPLTAVCVNSERHVSALLGGNCHVPLAVYCAPEPDSQLLLRAKVATGDGKLVISNAQRGHLNDAMLLAAACADNLLASGARELLQIQ